MYLGSTLLLLPLLALAEQQVPLKDQAAGWFDKAKAYVSNAIPTAPDLPDPIDAGASKVAGAVVEKINIRNWQRKLSPKPDVEEEWLLFLTGGNKTCYGKCGPVTAVWNVRHLTGQCARGLNADLGGIAIRAAPQGSLSPSRLTTPEARIPRLRKG
jgi:hypothetical protein